MDKSKTTEIWKLYKKDEKSQKGVKATTGETNIMSRSEFLKGLIEYAHEKADLGKKWRID